MGVDYSKALGLGAQLSAHGPHIFLIPGQLCSICIIHVYVHMVSEVSEEKQVNCAMFNALHSLYQTREHIMLILLKV